jgi:hypothetical protein
MNTPSEMTRFLEHFKKCPEAEFADVLLQPIEHSFTLSSFIDLVHGCGLEIAAPSINIFDKARESYFWNIEFTDAAVQERYDRLPDLDRWQIANYLLWDKSPMLWFYLRRSDDGIGTKSETQMAEEFLQREFVPTAETRRIFYLQESGEYKLMPTPIAYPGKHSKDVCRQILAHVAAKPGIRIRNILDTMQIEASFQVVNKLRMQLTTTAFPFLKS